MTAETALHTGMPPLNAAGPPLSFYEFWRPKYFYAPVFLYWVWLSFKHWSPGLSTIANPLLPMGGLTYDSKKATLDQVREPGRALIAPYVSWVRGNGDAAADADAALKTAEAAGLRLPFVVKPDIGCRGAGVRVARSREGLVAYFEGFPKGRGLMMQKLIDHEAEAGVFYVREPHESKGRIFSLTLKYFPYVFGDGRSTLRELIEHDPRAGRIAHVYLPRHAKRLDEVLPAGEPFRLAFAGSHSRGTIFRDGTPYITEAMTDAFDRLAKCVPEFHFGRFDVRFTDIGDLQRGAGFTVVEINGAGGEATHIWDSQTPIAKAYGTLMEQYSLLWRIGAANRRRGFKPESIWTIWKAYADEGRLVAQYPVND